MISINPSYQMIIYISDNILSRQLKAFRVTAAQCPHSSAALVNELLVNDKLAGMAI